jgi:hypothetical protein
MLMLVSLRKTKELGEPFCEVAGKAISSAWGTTPRCQNDVCAKAIAVSEGIKSTGHC